MTTHGHHQTVNIKIRLIMFFADIDEKSSTQSAKTKPEADCGSLFQNSGLKLRKQGKPLGYSVQFSSVQLLSRVQLFANPMNLSTPGLPVHHQLPEFTQSRPLSRWCHPAVSSSVILFSSYPQSLPASESFPMSQLLAWGGQSTRVSASASFLPKKSQGRSPSEWTGWIFLQSKGLSRVFSNTTVQKHQFFGAQPSSQSNSHIHTWLLEKP